MYEYTVTIMKLNEKQIMNCIAKPEIIEYNQFAGIVYKVHMKKNVYRRGDYNGQESRIYLIKGTVGYI